jgi:hypothetical protein
VDFHTKQVCQIKKLFIMMEFFLHLHHLGIKRINMVEALGNELPDKILKHGIVVGRTHSHQLSLANGYINKQVNDLFDQMTLQNLWVPFKLSRGTKVHLK